MGSRAVVVASSPTSANGGGDSLDSGEVPVGGVMRLFLKTREKEGLVH